MSFSERIVQWQPFFITVATLAGTLVGLLFISLSLNREKITSESNRVLFRLARRSFTDFLNVVLISFFFLIPDQESGTLGIEMFVIGLLRIKRLFGQITSSSGEGRKPTLMDLVREYVFPVLSTGGLLVAGFRMYQGGDEAKYAIYFFVVPVIATLLFTACSNAWLLLMERK